MNTPDLDALPDALSTHVGYLLVRLGKHAQRLFSLEIASLGLRPPHADILLTLAARGPLSQVEIAGTLAIERAHLVALLDQLEAPGLVQRTPDPSDRRRHAIVLTDAGRAAAGALGEIATRVEATLLEDLDAADRASFRAQLRSLARRAEEG